MTCPVLFHYSAGTSSGLTIVRTQQAAKVLTALNKPDTVFWHPFDQSLATSRSLYTRICSRVNSSFTF